MTTTTSDLKAVSATRKWRWAALLLQIEVLGALGLAVLAALTAPVPVSPMPVLFAILAAAILMPLGSAIERGSHAAGLMLAVMFALRAFSAFSAPPEVLLRTAPLLLLELLVFGAAVLAMTKVPAPAAEPMDSKRLLTTALPIVLAFAFIVYMRAWPGQRLAFLGLFMGLLLLVLHRMPVRMAKPRLQAPPLYIIDIVVGLLTIAGSLWVLLWFGEAASRPGVMLVPSVLIVPLLALVYLPLGFVWIGVGIGARKQQPWADKARVVAAVPLFLLLILAAPIATDLVVGFLKSTFQSARIP